MYNREEIAANLREFVYTTFPLARQRAIGDDTSLIEQGIIDSMGILEIVTFVETHFSIVLSDDEMLGENFNSIESLATFVQTKLNCPVASDS